MFRGSNNFLSKKIKPLKFTFSQDALGKSLKESKKLDMVIPVGDLTTGIVHGNYPKLGLFRWDEKTKRYISGKSIHELTEEIRPRK